MSPSTERARRVLTRKGGIIRDSLVVVRGAARAVTRNRFLLRLIVTVVVGTVTALFAWRTLANPGTGDRRTVMHSVVVGARFVVVLSLQFLVASWLFRTWRDNRPERIRHLWGQLARRLPAFAVCALILAWLDHATAVATTVTLARAGVTFAFTYSLSYAVPAAAVYGSGLLRGFGHAWRVWRATFGADLLAWSGVWMVNGAMSLVAAIPDALDLYAPRSDGGTRPSLVGRMFNWLIVMPVSISALAIAAAFATVIFFALEESRSPAGFPKEAVQTVSGLELAD